MHASAALDTGPVSFRRLKRFSPNPAPGPVAPGNFLHTAIVALALWALMLALPSQVKALSTLRIGLSEEPRTLNVWLASDANSNNILGQIYQPLYLREPKNLEMVPWLAADLPEFDNDGVV
jgi:peptide/nickel transport system substrate-binding protein